MKPINVGLLGMSIFTLLPIGILQLRAAIDHGYWYARSAEFMQQPIIDMLVWMRVPGDVIFSVGVCLLVLFLLPPTAAAAGMIGTSEIIAEQNVQADRD